ACRLLLRATRSFLLGRSPVPGDVGRFLVPLTTAHKGFPSTISFLFRRPQDVHNQCRVVPRTRRVIHRFIHRSIHSNPRPVHDVDSVDGRGGGAPEAATWQAPAVLVTTHVLSGAVIGALAPDVPAALSRGFVSHFVLDAVPHWGCEPDDL